MPRLIVRSQICVPAKYQSVKSFEVTCLVGTVDVLIYYLYTCLLDIETHPSILALQNAWHCPAVSRQKWILGKEHFLPVNPQWNIARWAKVSSRKSKLFVCRSVRNAFHTSECDSSLTAVGCIMPWRPAVYRTSRAQTSVCLNLGHKLRATKRITFLSPKDKYVGGSRVCECAAVQSDREGFCGTYVLLR
jgi:hypothetical protein